MDDIKKNKPDCYGILDVIFPLKKNGLRETPDHCHLCSFKVDCLKSAVYGDDGFQLKDEIVDREYNSGQISFFQRWSKKKLLYKKKRSSEVQESRRQ